MLPAWHDSFKTKERDSHAVVSQREVGQKETTGPRVFLPDGGRSVITPDLSPSRSEPKYCIASYQVVSQHPTCSWAQACDICSGFPKLFQFRVMAGNRTPCHVILVLHLRALPRVMPCHVAAILHRARLHPAMLLCARRSPRDSDGGSQGGCEGVPESGFYAGL